MATKIYGASDDLIEFKGDVCGEVGNYGTDEEEHGELVICSDGTLLEVKYGKGDMAVWGIILIKAGGLFNKIEACSDEDADPHSDVAYFNDGLKWAYVASEWEKVK
ncbi:hypothetical protein LCGC14_3099650 [marine sediment metagenome]|uniref:Uncharacterized protein n=1 Tax=marine sediment metagenome TaxID=412755 RepID=A0A0F8W840_9ZZZZ